MRQAKQRIVGPQGQQMTRTATEITDPNGLRLRMVEDVIDLEWLQAKYKRRTPLWRRVLATVARQPHR